MVSAALKALFLLSFFCIAVAEEENRILSLTDATIDKAIKDYPIILIKFYAPWCGHCRHLAPIYKKAGEILYGMDPSLVMAEIDATVERESADAWKIKGYPTMILFKNGEKVDTYEGARTEEALTKYMISHADN
ncbi:unnamed protein product [Blepharisma stoltei]|uniref:Thioredoxin domain-containing protein n=1 Tax=Blepharisma stoltei TaxID=1481888 RepID=A0AAU9JWF5_9CILI|nr:unnamed protein product [Blepharisma stoltei]